MQRNQVLQADQRNLRQGAIGLEGSGLNRKERDEEGGGGGEGRE